MTEKTRPQGKEEAFRDVPQGAMITAKLSEAVRNYHSLLEEVAELIKPYPNAQKYIVRKTVQTGHYLVYAKTRQLFDVSLEDIQTLIDDYEQEGNDSYHQRLRAMPYAEYLLTDHWQEQRQAALERANHRCQVCNATITLNVHHRTYERRGDELPEDLIVLCQGCHQLFHDNGKLEVER